MSDDSTPAQPQRPRRRPVRRGPAPSTRGNKDAPKKEPRKKPDTVVRAETAQVLPMTKAARPSPRAPLERRRRRSALVTPALLAPTPIPEDAPGRVEFVVVHAPTGPEQIVGREPVDGLGRERRPIGWIAVGLLGVVLVVVFVTGMLVTR